jgi:hypothetical protein
MRWMYQCLRGVLLKDMIHPLIHAELARADAADIDRRLRGARLTRPLTVTSARRRPWRRTARRIIRGLPHPVRSSA